MSSIYAAPGESFASVLSGVASGLVGTIGVQIVNSEAQTVVLPRATTGIIEYPVGTGVYTATRTAPTTEGHYEVIWDTGGALTPTNTYVDALVVTYSAPDAVQPSGIDLTTLPAVKEFLQQTQATSDPVLTHLITRASRVILRYSGREFAPASTNLIRKFRVNGRGRVHLAPYDLRTLTGLRMDTDTASPLVLNTDQYRLEPFPSTEGVYSWISLREVIHAGRWRTREVEVTGDWGFASVPSDVEHAAIVTTADWFRKDVTAFSTQFNVESGRVELARIIPDEAKAVIDLYRRPRVG